MHLLHESPDGGLQQPPPPALFAALRAPSEILFGSGQRKAVSWLAPRLGTRALVCVDPFFSADPLFRDLISLLEAAGVETAVFDRVVPELPSGSIMEAVAAAQSHGADLFVAVGGGSCIDLAKVAACLHAHGGVPSDYYGEFNVPGPVLPLIAIPTTAGTGSEVTPVAVITDPQRQSKVGISSPYLIPAVAICDPELTASCPPSVTASAGADALAHCIESYTAVRRPVTSELAGERVFVGRSELTDGFALAGISAIARGLPRAFANPNDVEARELVMYGALMGGLAFGTGGTAAAHALQYPIGALTHTAHGVGVGLLLPYVLEYNRTERVPELAEIARRFGVRGEDDDELAAQTPAVVQNFLAAVGIPVSLAEIDFDPERIEWAIGEGRAAVRLSENNPRPLDDNAIEILMAAQAGILSNALSARSDRGQVSA